MTTPNVRVMAPDLCAAHQHDALVHRLHITEAGPWQITLVGLSILLSQAAFQDRRVQRRTAGQLEDFSLILAEIGCLACFMPASTTSRSA